MAGEKLDIPITAHLEGAGDFKEVLSYLNKIQVENDRLKASNQQVAKSVADVGASMRSQRQGVQQLGMQFQDLGTSIGAGTSPMQAFIQQSGQAGYAMSQMGGIAGRVGAFLMNPWVSAVTAGAMILYAFVKSSRESSDALDKQKEKLDNSSSGFMQLQAAIAEANDQTLLFLEVSASQADQKVDNLRRNLKKLNGELDVAKRIKTTWVTSFFGERTPAAIQEDIASVTVELGKLEDASFSAQATLLRAQKAEEKANARKGNAGNKSGKTGSDSATKAANEATRAVNDAIEAERKWQDELSKSTTDLLVKFNTQNDVYKSVMFGAEQANTSFFDKLHEGFTVADYAYAQNAEKFTKMGEAYDAVGQSVADGFKGMITGAQSFGDAMKSVIGEVINQLFKLYVTQQITGFISKGLQSVFGMPSIDGMRAIGGQVQSGGAYMVGERGPEMFVPSRSGSIVPNNKMGGGAMTIHVDARGASDPAAVRAQVNQGIMEAAPYIIAASKNQTLKSAGRARLPGVIV